MYRWRGGKGLGFLRGIAFRLFLIVDEREGAILAVLSRLRAILLVDDVPRCAPPDARLRLLARPFSAERLLAEVGPLLV